VNNHKQHFPLLLIAFNSNKWVIKFLTPDWENNMRESTKKRKDFFIADFYKRSLVNSDIEQISGQINFQYKFFFVQKLMTHEYLL
jgi:hypothetical protein